MRSNALGRREFITLLGSAAAVWPLAAEAQQAPARRIGLLIGRAESDPIYHKWIAAFLHGLGEAGWIPGRNVHIEYRWATADVERIKQFANELVTLKLDVILADGTPVTAALKRATSTIPIVFVVVSDPVGAGFVQSLAHPGGNARPTPLARIAYVKLMTAARHTSRGINRGFSSRSCEG
jgi:putative ABC transport system substrate-binding protein